MPSKPSQTNPSMNWCIANNVGSEAKSSSRRCLTFVRVTAPIVPRTPLTTKLAAAEKHTRYPPGSRQCHVPNEVYLKYPL
jgi:hypothetical protein